MTHELSPGKSMCILGIVIGCFAILWPNVFYPMLKGPTSPSVDTVGIRCCKNLFSTIDVYNVKLTKKSIDDIDASTTFLEEKLFHCRHSFKRNRFNHPPKMTTVMRMRKSMGYMLHRENKTRAELKLARHFVDAQSTRERFVISKYAHPERSMFPRALNPSPQEPNSDVLPQSSARIPLSSSASSSPFRERESSSSRLVSTKKPPMNGIRPPFMTGVSHPVIPQKANGSMNVLMPLYTIGIVIFFGYTILKLMCKKQETSTSYGRRDTEFCQYVFNEKEPHECALHGRTSGYVDADNIGVRRPMTGRSSELVVSAISSLLEEVNRDILERKMSDSGDEENATRHSPINKDSDHVGGAVLSFESDQQSSRMHETIRISNKSSEFVKQIVDGSSASSTDDEQKVNGRVHVMGIEVNQSFGANDSLQQLQPKQQRCRRRLLRSKWSPVYGGTGDNVSDSRTPMKAAGHSEVVVLEHGVPKNSEILVGDAYTENVVEVTDSSLEVLVRSKMTLNVIANVVDENQHTSEYNKTMKTIKKIIGDVKDDNDKEVEYEIDTNDGLDLLNVEHVPDGNRNEFNRDLQNRDHKSKAIFESTC